MRVQDTWFLLLISAIEAHLRLVGDIFNLESTDNHNLLRFVKDLRISDVVRVNKHRYWINIFHVCGVI